MIPHHAIRFRSVVVRPNVTVVFIVLLIVEEARLPDEGRVVVGSSKLSLEFRERLLSRA